MKLYQRFAYYLIGFTLGIFFVAAIWNGKGVSCNYFPNSRVLNDIRNKPFHYSAAADSSFAQGWISKQDIKVILTHGDVDFSRSNEPEDHGKRYIVKGQTSAHQPVEIKVINYADRALLKSIAKVSQ